MIFCAQPALFHLLEAGARQVQHLLRCWSLWPQQCPSAGWQVWVQFYMRQQCWSAISGAVHIQRPDGLDEAGRVHGLDLLHQGQPFVQLRNLRRQRLHRDHWSSGASCQWRIQGKFCCGNWPKIGNCTVTRWATATVSAADGLGLPDQLSVCRPTHTGCFFFSVSRARPMKNNTRDLFMNTKNNEF